MKNSRRQTDLDVALLIDTACQWTRHIILGINRYKSMLASPWNLLVEPHGSADPLALPHGWQGDGVIADIRFPKMAAQLRKYGVPVVNVSDSTVATATKRGGGLRCRVFRRCALIARRRANWRWNISRNAGSRTSPTLTSRATNGTGRLIAISRVRCARRASRSAQATKHKIAHGARRIGASISMRWARGCVRCQSRSPCFHGV